MLWSKAILVFEEGVSDMFESWEDVGAVKSRDRYSITIQDSEVLP